ncbi:hypothetical protein HOY82DRAFT_645311, partial [Tuber indicum]
IILGSKRLGIIVPHFSNLPHQAAELRQNGRQENMALLHISSNTKQDRRQEVILLASLGWEYKCIAENTAVPTSTVHNTIKRFQAAGSTNDTHHSGHLPKITKNILQAVESLADANSCPTLQELTEKLHTLVTEAPSGKIDPEVAMARKYSFRK